MDMNCRMFKGKVKTPENVVSFQAFKVKRDLDIAFQKWAKTEKKL